MANTFRLKRSAVPAKVPVVADLALGELAVNTYDGKLYMKKDVSGTESIVLINSAGGGGSGDLLAANNLSDLANAGTARTNLGLAIGTHVQAYDAGLQSIAGLTTTADRLIYTTASDTYAVTTFTAFGRSLVDDTDAATARTTLGLTIGTNVQAYDAELAAIAGLASAANSLPYFTGSGTAALATFTAAGRALVDDVDAAAQRATLGVTIGTNVQAYDAGLQSIAGLTTAADRGIYTTASDTYAVYTLTAAGRAILDDADASAQRTTLGLGTAATRNTGTSGSVIPTLDGAGTWTASHTFNDNVTIEAPLQRQSGKNRSNLGAPTITDMALYDAQMNNKIAFYPEANVIFEKSTDGTNWTTESVSSTNVKRLLAGADAKTVANIAIPRDAVKYRIRITNNGNYVYLNTAYLYASANGNTFAMEMWKKNFTTGLWERHTSDTTQQGSWPGHHVINYAAIPFHPSQHFNEVYLLITPVWAHASNTITLYALEMHGGYPAGRRTIYTVDENKLVEFPAGVTSTAFTENGVLLSSKYAALSHTHTMSQITDMSAFGRTLVDDADAAAARTTLGLGTIATQASSGVSITGGSVTGITDLAVADGGTGASDAGTARTNLGLAIGTNVQAYDAGLQSIAGLTTTADRGIYTTASDTYAVYTLTAAGRAILDDVDAAAQRTTLGLGTAAVVNTGTSGATIPRNDTANTFSETQTATRFQVGTFLMDDDIGLGAGIPGFSFDSNDWLAYYRSTNRFEVGIGSVNAFSVTGSGATILGNTVWHAGNDGAGTGLDADTLDGVQGSAFATLAGTQVFTGVNSFSSRFISSGGPTTTPAAGAHSNAFQVSNADTAYGMLFGVSSATGVGFIQSQRVDGTAAVYGLSLNPNGGAVAAGGAVNIPTAPGLNPGLLNVFEPSLGGTATNTKTIATFRTSSANEDKIIFDAIRHTTGTDWQTASLRMRRMVDASNHNFLEFANNGTYIGWGATRRVAIYDGVNSAMDILGRLNLTTALGTNRTSIDWGQTQSGLTIWNIDNTPLSLGTSGVNRMNISATGIITLGTQAPQSTALAGMRANGNNFEWGHTNTAGYHGTLGSFSGAGDPYISFNAEHGTNSNTFRTRGRFGGAIYMGGGDGRMHFGHLAAHTADNQTLAIGLTLDINGNLGLGTTSPTNFGAGWRALTIGESGKNGVVRLTSGTVTADMFTDTTALYIRTASSHSMVLRTNDTDRLTIDNTGQVTLTNFNPTSEFAAGFRGAPVNRQDSSYTLVLADSGKTILKGTNTASQTYTIPANSSVAYPVGTILTFANLGNVSCSIAITTDPMYLSPGGSTGTRTLAAFGMATAVKVTSTNWMISGAGLT